MVKGKTNNPEGINQYTKNGAGALANKPKPPSIFGGGGAAFGTYGASGIRPKQAQYAPPRTIPKAPTVLKAPEPEKPMPKGAQYQPINTITANPTVSKQPKPLVAPKFDLFRSAPKQSSFVVAKKDGLAPIDYKKSDVKGGRGTVNPPMVVSPNITFSPTNVKGGRGTVNPTSVVAPNVTFTPTNVKGGRGTVNPANVTPAKEGIFERAGSKIGGILESARMQAKGAIGGAKIGASVTEGNRIKNALLGASMGREKGSKFATISEAGEVKGARLGSSIDRALERTKQAVNKGVSRVVLAAKDPKTELAAMRERRIVKRNKGGSFGNSNAS